MQDFLKRLKTKVKGIESMHRCGDILIKEDIKTGECEVYSKEENKRKRKSIRDRKSTRLNSSHM